MAYTREDFIAAKRTLDAAYKAYVDTPEYKAWSEAFDKLEEIKDELGDETHTCEGCGDPIFDGDPMCYSAEDSIATCVDCSPTWQDFKNRPEDFYRWDESAQDMLYHTAESAAPFIEAHLAKGGSLSDSMAR